MKRHLRLSTPSKSRKTIKKLLQLLVFGAFFTRTIEGVSNTLLCFNRATAIVLPFYHEKACSTTNVNVYVFWSRRSGVGKNIRVAFFIQFVCAAVHGLEAVTYPANWKRYPPGRLFVVVSRVIRLKNPFLHYSWSHTALQHDTSPWLA